MSAVAAMLDKLAPAMQADPLKPGAALRVPPRYLLFAGSEYYARGGFADLKGSFDLLQTARNAAEEQPEDHWYQIVDVETLAIVEKRGEAYFLT